MVLSPLDIRNKSFSTKMRGFNPEEVDDFLDQVINDYEETIRQKRDMEKALKHAEEKLSYFNELKDALNQSIIVAQDTADKLKENASKEAAIIVSTAEQQAKDMVTEATQKSNEIVRDASEKARRLAVETDDLKKRTRVFHQRLSLLLESQLEIVKSDEWDELLQPFSSYIGDHHDTVKEVLQDELANAHDIPAVDLDATMPIQSDKRVSKVTEETTATVVFPEAIDPDKK